MLLCTRLESIALFENHPLISSKTTNSDVICCLLLRSSFPLASCFRPRGCRQRWKPWVPWSLSAKKTGSLLLGAIVCPTLGIPRTTWPWRGPSGSSKLTAVKQENLALLRGCCFSSFMVQIATISQHTALVYWPLIYSFGSGNGPRCRLLKAIQQVLSVTSKYCACAIATGAHSDLCLLHLGGGGNQF